MHKKKVLIIDDSETSLLLLNSLFDESSDVVVHSEKNSSVAFQKIIDIKPDIIILDLMMPEVDGFQILHDIKKDLNLKDIPVIVLSAIHDSKTIDKVKQLGAVDFIFKPFIVDVVVDTILFHLNRIKSGD